MTATQTINTATQKPVFTVVPIPSNKESDAPYYLSNIMHSFNLSQRDLFDHLAERFSLKSTYPTFNKFIRLRRWSNELAGISEQLQIAIFTWLTEHDVPEKEVLRCWENGNKVALDERGTMKTLVKRIRTLKNGQTNEKQQEPVRIIPELTMLEPEIQRHFKFSKDPFKDEVWGPEDLFVDDRQRYTREQMLNAIESRSILAIVGEVGAGKTETKRSLIEKINELDNNIFLIEPETIDKDEIKPHTLMTALAAEMDITIPKNNEARTKMVRQELARRVKAGHRFAFVFEEAHELSDKLLKQLKRIWEWNDGFRKLVSIILIGQTELGSKLGETKLNIREFSKRCTIIRMQPLGQNNIRAYVHFKLERAGIKKPEVLITDDAISAIYKNLLTNAEHAYGITRKSTDEQIDISYPLNVNAWLSDAFRQAYQIKDDQVTAETITDCKGKL